MHASLEWFWFSISQLCITRLLFTLFLSLSCAHLAEWPTHVVPVTCEIICASGAMWFYLGFCASCPVFVFKPPLLPCIYDSIRFGLIRYYSNQNPIAPPRQHPSGQLLVPPLNVYFLYLAIFLAVGGTDWISISKEKFWWRKWEISLIVSGWIHAP